MQRLESYIFKARFPIPKTIFPDLPGDFFSRLWEAPSHWTEAQPFGWQCWWSLGVGFGHLSPEDINYGTHKLEYDLNDQRHSSHHYFETCLMQIFIERFTIYCLLLYFFDLKSNETNQRISIHPHQTCPLQPRGVAFMLSCVRCSFLPSVHGRPSKPAVMMWRMPSHGPGPLEWPWGDLWRVPWEMRTLMLVFFWYCIFLLLDILVGRYLIVIFDDW